MASLGELGRLSDDEYAELNERVDQFHAARSADASAALEKFLPASGNRLRPFILVELIKTDMELRVRAGLPIRLEMYLGRFQDDLPSSAVPVSLIAEEYRLRHKHADKPKLDEYRYRFREQFDSLVKQVGEAPPRPGTVGFDSAVDNPTPAGGANPTRVTAVPEKHPPKPPVVSSKGASTSSDVLPAGLGFKLIRRIGKGAFGEVYEAEAPGGVKVAIKRILRALDHPASQGEIESLEAIKTLSHPFLLKTNAYWVFEDRLIIVMDLADESLADRIEFHKSSGLPGVPPEEAILFFEQAAAALDYLHSKNVSHRDVKPQNLLLLRGYAKVADFGLARNHEHTLTNVGGEIGTPPFMAPEVWNHRVSLHSDQYSLAATYVAARLGHPPFTTRILHELADLHVHSTPNLTPMPLAEQAVVLKAMAKRPEHRYPNCVAFAAALRKAVLEPLPKEAPSGGRWGIGMVIASALLLCCLILGGVYSFLPRPETVATRPDTPTKQMWCPDGWSPVAETGTTSHAGKDFHKRLTRNVAGEDLVAILILPARPGEPPPYYMLENKITNRVFRAEWERAEGNPASAVRMFQETNPELRAQLLPGEWRKGAIDLKGNRLGIDGPQAEVPVVAVAVPEAMLIAQELGGQLPRLNQWLKAVGVMDGRRPGPAGADIDLPVGDDIGRRAKLRERGLALGLETGPWPVKRQSPDVSFCDIHELLSNGQEWTGDENNGGARLSLFRLPATDYHAVLVGQGWEKITVRTLDDLAERPREESWRKWKEYASFRIVLEPP